MLRQANGFIGQSAIKPGFQRFRSGKSAGRCLASDYGKGNRIKAGQLQART